MGKPKIFTDPEPKWNAFADLLLLRADQIATWGLKTSFMPYTADGGASAVNYTTQPKAVLFDWDLGARAGLRYSFDRDQWDAQIFYTWFRTEGKNRASAENALSNVTSAFLGEWLTFAFSSKSGKILWNILLNSIDGDLGRISFPGKGFAFRPRLGLKGAWIRQSIYSRWVASSNETAEETIKNDFWGVGPKGGADTKWEIGSAGPHAFHLFGDVSLALLGGGWTFKDIQKSSMNSEIRSINPTAWAATLMGHALAGVGWDLKLKNRSNFGARAGYELQYWFDQLKIFTFLEGTLHAALVLQGGMLDVHYDF